MSRNRLAESSSPYLRQHKDNPVHWQPWDEEAFEQAKGEDKPIFLSVGYSSCHWCHVMEHESFEDEDIARLLNERFVSIKVDREERPDVDEAYMTAVQIYNGHGGWPMTLFLTPDKKPFFAGTYFPAEDRGEYPGFKTIAAYFGEGWKNHKSEFTDAANEFAASLQQAMSHESPETKGTLDWSLIDAAISQYKTRFDSKNGGFEGKPKFPPHQTLQLLLHLAEKRGSSAPTPSGTSASTLPLGGGSGNNARKDCLEMATLTLDKMMAGGIHDQVGGGFHRYSTDEKWLLPHFEKMLYDNAQMLRNYAVAHRITGNKEYERVCKRIIAWLEREMLSPEGLFYSALDADSEGEEGVFYTWDYDEAAKICPPETLAALGFKKEGNFNDEATGKPSHRNIPNIATAAPESASQNVALASPPAHLPAESHTNANYDEALNALLEARSKRIHPALDNKCLTAWNGLAISALAIAGRTDLAENAANAILKHNPIPHQIVKGKPEGQPFLDAAYFIEGLLDLAEATSNTKWRDHAQQAFDKMSDFRDENGGWYFTSAKHEKLFGRTKPIFDNATPSPLAVMTRCALRLNRTEIAKQDLQSTLGWLERAPFATATLLLTAAEYLAEQPATIAIPKVRIEISPSECAVVNDSVSHNLSLIPPQGWHLQTPAEIEITGLSDAQVNGTTITGTPPAGKEGEAKAKIKFQICTDRECLPPEEKELPLVWYRP